MNNAVGCFLRALIRFKVFYSDLFASSWVNSIGRRYLIRPMKQKLYESLSFKPFGPIIVIERSFSVVASPSLALI